MKCKRFAVALLALPFAACTTPSKIAGTHTHGYSLYTISQTLDLENADRVRRIRRLAVQDGVPPPKLAVLGAPADVIPGVTHRIPVVRLSFPENIFFNTDSSIPLPSSDSAFRLIAQEARGDAPDIAITIIGNTDSTGTDAYNMALSKRRALAAMRALAALGVNPDIMTTVAIGDHQPVATNATPEGRALNRRVDFLISDNADANLAVVQYVAVNKAFFADSNGVVKPPAENTVAVFRARPDPAHGTNVSLQSLGPLSLLPPQAGATGEVNPEDVQLQPLPPPPLVQPRPLEPVVPKPLA